MSENLMQQALELYAAGKKNQARSVLAKILQTEPDNYNAWFGMALCLDDPAKQRYCLGQVLDIHPNHPQAREMLQCLDLDSRMTDMGIDAEPDTTRMAEFVFSSYFEDPGQQEGSSFSYPENIDSPDEFTFSYPDELGRQGEFDFLYMDPATRPPGPGSAGVEVAGGPGEPDASSVSDADRLVSDLRHLPTFRKKARRRRGRAPLAIVALTLVAVCCLLGIPLSLAAAAVASPLNGGGLVMVPVYAVVSAEKGGEIKVYTVSVRFLPGSLPEDTQVGIAPLSIGLMERGIAAGIQVVGVNEPLQYPAIFTFMLSKPVLPGLLVPLESRASPWKAWRPAQDLNGNPLFGLVTADGLTVVALADHLGSYAVTYDALEESQAESVDAAVLATIQAATPVLAATAFPVRSTVLPTRKIPMPASSPTPAVSQPSQPTPAAPATALVPLPASPSQASVTLTPGAGSGPVCPAERVVRDTSVTIAVANLPPNTNFAVLMSDIEKPGASGLQAAAFNSEADGVLTFTFPIPVELAGSAHIAYWLESSAGVVCFNWFENQTSP